MTNSSKLAGLSTFALVMLITGAVDSIRNLPAAALFGSSLIFFFIFSAIVFLIPTALVSAELSATWSEKNGVYDWVRLAFGEKFAFLTIWLQWATNLVWLPTILSFIAGLIAYLIDPALAQNKVFLVVTILVTFWFITLINLRGIHTSSQFVSICTMAGLVIPMILIIALAAVWVALGKPMQINFSAASIFPSLSHPQSWVSLTAIMTAFLGMELASVHVKDVRDAQRTFPRALYLSVWLILVTMILGSLAIAIVLPHDQISLVDGVMQAITGFFEAYHMNWCIPVVIAMILLGSLGGTISWIISPAKGLLQAAQSGYLPEFFQKENRNGVAANLLITQAVLVSVMCTAFLFMPSISGSYWLLTALSTQMYMLMYVTMFMAAVRLRYKYPNQARPFSIPGGKAGMWVTCMLGLIGCTITLIVGFFPPEGVEVGSLLRYEMIFVSGMVAMLLPILFFYNYKNRKQKRELELAAEGA